MAVTTNTVPGTFKANDSTWKVTKDGVWIVCLDAGHHVGPATQWIQCVQDAAKAHREAWLAE